MKPELFRIQFSPSQFGIVQTVLLVLAVLLALLVVARAAIRRKVDLDEIYVGGFAMAICLLVRHFLPRELPLYSYGVMLMIGFFGALGLARVLARRSGINPEIFINAGLVALVSGIVGARLSHVLENFRHYTDADRSFRENLWNAVNIRSGGLTFYGGLLLATGCTIIYGWIRKAPIRRGMDIVAPCVMVGLAFGRIGCLLNGCCYGAECDLPWAVTYPYGSNAYIDEVNVKPGDPEKKPRVVPESLRPRNAADGRMLPLADIKARHPALLPITEHEHSFARHPAQMYSTITAFLIAALLVAYYTLAPLPGRVFALMLLLEAPSRYLLELLRAEPARLGRGSGSLEFLPPMSFSMVLSVGLMLLGGVLWIGFTRYARRRGETEGTAAGEPAPVPA